VTDEAEADPDTTMWQLSFPITLSAAQALQAGGRAALKAEALSRCAQWHHPIPALLAATPAEHITGYPAFDRDLPSAALLRSGTEGSNVSGRGSKEWQQRSRVTLIGDAAHAMSPFKGQGANQSLLDAVQLARAIAHARFDEEEEINEDGNACAMMAQSNGASAAAAAVDAASSAPSTAPAASTTVSAGACFPGRVAPSLSSALASFEAAMLARAESKVLESRANAAFLHSPAVLSEGNNSRAYVAKRAAAAVGGPSKAPPDEAQPVL